MKDSIVQWIEEFVSVYNPDLGVIPCPFAKKAIIKDTIQYIEFNSDNVTSILSELGNNWDDTYEVVVMYASTDTMSSEQLSDITDKFNAQFNKNDIAALEDHPHAPETVAGVSMNWEQGMLILVQRLSKINQAAKILHKQGYYDNWPPEYYDEVVGWRTK